MSSEELGPEGDGGEELSAEIEGGDGTFVLPERKRPVGKTTVAMFALFAVAGVGTYFMYVRSGAQAAAAADPKSQQVIKQFMSERDKNVAQMQKMAKESEGLVQLLVNYPSVTQVPLTDLRTNPFRATAPAPEDGSALTRRDQEREKKRREEERQAVLRAVQGLQLQSVVHSERAKACMINNTLYREGQQVEDFTIEKISPDAVVVRNGAFRFELRMQR